MNDRPLLDLVKPPQSAEDVADAVRLPPRRRRSGLRMVRGGGVELLGVILVYNGQHVWSALPLDGLMGARRGVLAAALVLACSAESDSPSPLRPRLRGAHVEPSPPSLTQLRYDLGLPTLARGRILVINAHAPNTRDADRYITPDGGLNRDIDPEGGYLLSDDQLGRLIGRMRSTARGHSGSLCTFEPHHVLVVEDQAGTRIGWLEICFICSEMRTDIRALDHGFDFSAVASLLDEFGIPRALPRPGLAPAPSYASLIRLLAPALRICQEASITELRWDAMSLLVEPDGRISELDGLDAEVRQCVIEQLHRSPGPSTRYGGRYRITRDNMPPSM